MNRTISSALRGSVVEEEVALTTLELGRACRTTEQQIEVWVSEGVLQPTGSTREAWRFHGDSLARMRLATRLMQESLHEHLRRSHRRRSGASGRS